MSVRMGGKSFPPASAAILSRSDCPPHPRERSRPIYDSGQSDSCVIGKLTQDESLDATIHVPSMLAKHFAIVGTTGVGKSTAVTLLLNKAIAADPKLACADPRSAQRVRAAFPDQAVVIDTDTLDLPVGSSGSRSWPRSSFVDARRCRTKLDILRDVIADARKRHSRAENPP